MSAASPEGLGGARDAPAGDRSGESVFLVNAHERIVLATPAEAAVLAEIQRCDARSDYGGRRREGDPGGGVVRPCPTPRGAGGIDCNEERL
jgi:hypothetical protein